MIYFLKISDEGKIKFLSENLPEKVNQKDLKIPEQKW
jgi:hypothetical protein